MSNTNIGHRPAPGCISFDRRCFEQIGTRIEYTVTRSAIHSGPEKFTDRAQAEAFAARCNRTVSERSVPVMRRISWR